MKERIIVEKLVENIEKVIVGKRNEILNLLKGIFSGGNVLLEDVPGVGKTKLVKALSKSLDMNYRRIQFTPDLLPSDILGVSIYNPKIEEFEFKKGPIFSNILLADEINRTPPKTQSALLEAMEEFQVSEGGKTYPLDSPFFVIATQNPVEYEGAYRLPEAQMDRFAIKMQMGYPTIENEVKILMMQENEDELLNLKQVITREEFLEVIDEITKVKVDKSISEYIIRIVNATRSNGYYTTGISTRGAIALLKVSKASAYLNGRDYVIVDDVKENVVLTFAHRLDISSKMKFVNLSVESSLIKLIDEIKVPKVLDTW